MSAFSLMTFPAGLVDEVRTILPTSALRLARWAWQVWHFSYLANKHSVTITS